MKLGVCAQPFFDQPLSRAVEIARHLGFEAMELPVHQGNPFVDLDGNRSEHESLLQQLREAGLEISALSVHQEGQLLLGPHGADTDGIVTGTPAEKVEFARGRLTKAARVASQLGVDVVCGFTGCEDYSRWFPWPLRDGYERMAPVFRERLLPILDSFGRFGVTFALECHPRQFAYNLETAVWALDLVDGHEALGFNYDPANLVLAGMDPVAFIAELGQRIVHVHAKDAEKVAHNVGQSGLLAHGAWDRPDRGFRFRVPGWGDLSWRRVISELQLQGYRGVLAVEHEDPTMDRTEGLTKAARFLAPLILVDPPPSSLWW